MNTINKPPYRKIVLTGGGTMGHITPHIAIIPDLFKSFESIDYIGTKTGIEKEAISKISNVTYHSISSTKFNRTNILKNFTIPFKLIKAISEAKSLLKELQPDVIFSKGGYVSVPVVIAGNKLGIPIIIHESDLSMGLANRISVKYANVVCSTFPTTAKTCKKGVWTGSPINPRLEFANPENARKKYKIDRKKPTITITGGSLGASAINIAIEKLLPTFCLEYNVIHITGKNKKLSFSHPSYHQIEFTDDIGEIFKASDLVITRAGSNTIFELALLKVPMILIPLPRSASRGDQLDNAKYFKRLGLAKIVYQNDIISDLPKTIKNCLINKASMKNALINADYKNGKNKLLKEIIKATKFK